MLQGRTITHDRKLFEYEYGEMKKALSSGWGRGFKVEFGKPDWEYIQNLRYNTAVFSAFKCNHEIKDAYKLLVDDSGNPRSWKEFLRDARRVSEKYNARWLQTEYNTAHTTAKAAKAWRQFLEDANRYPNLMYVIMKDERVRISHAILNGIIRSIIDPFWNKYYPPIDWNCRCMVLQTDKPVTKIPEDIPDVPDVFAINAGKEAKIFSEEHPYYKNMTEKEKADALLFVQQYIRNAEDVLARHIKFTSLSNDYDKAYFNADTGGFVGIHSRHKRDPKTFKYELEAAQKFADRGYEVLLLAETPVAKQFDANVDNIATEIKVAFGYRNILARAKDAIQKKAERIVYNIQFNNPEELRKKLISVKRHYPQLEIYYIQDGVLHSFE